MLVLPTAAAYQHPERVVFRAAEWFGPLGGQVEGLMVVDRASANDPGMAATTAKARFIYLAGGSPLHLRAALKKSAVFESLREPYLNGAVIAGAGAGAGATIGGGLGFAATGAASTCARISCSIRTSSAMTA